MGATGEKQGCKGALVSFLKKSWNAALYQFEVGTSEFKFFLMNFPLFPCCFHVQCLYRCYCNIGSCLVKPFSETLCSVSLGHFRLSWLWLVFLTISIFWHQICFLPFLHFWQSLFIHSSLTRLNSFHRKPRVIQILLYIVHILSWAGCFSKNILKLDLNVIHYYSQCPWVFIQHDGTINVTTNCILIQKYVDG